MGWKRETLVAPKGLKRLALKTPDARFDHQFDHQFDHFFSPFILHHIVSPCRARPVRASSAAPALALPNSSI